MKPSELFDRGAQPERTLLAWGRTCLALAVVVAVLVKVLAAEVDPAVVGLTICGLALPVLTWLLAVARYRRVHRVLTRPGVASTLPAGGSAVAAATLTAVLCGCLALVLVLR